MAYRCGFPVMRKSSVGKCKSAVATKGARCAKHQGKRTNDKMASIRKALAAKKLKKSPRKSPRKGKKSPAKKGRKSARKGRKSAKK